MLGAAGFQWLKKLRKGWDCMSGACTNTRHPVSMEGIGHICSSLMVLDETAKRTVQCKSIPGLNFIPPVSCCCFSTIEVLHKAGADSEVDGWLLGGGGGLVG